MKTIYLASQSRPRRRLLRGLGIKFKAVSPRAKEMRKPAKMPCAEFARRNALKKARSVASGIKNGVIIAADTITIQGNKLFGKPRSLCAARRMLKAFSRWPQVVYTGVAVIDTETGKTRVSGEKTKVYMDRLNDKQISAYFRRVSPLDKAGSFDIQGRGALFIRRIDGCFYNVVGLPLRKLYLMLNKLNIKLLSFSLSTIYYLLSTVFISGCSTEYNIVTQQQEAYFYNTDKEIQIGQAIAKQVESEYKPVDDPLMQKRLEDIGRRISGVCDRKDIDYQFKALADEEVNAVSLPGGFVYVNNGLLEKASGDDEVACVVAHEVGHIVARHGIKKLQAVMGYSILRLLTAAMPGGGQVGSAADLAFAEIMSGYDRSSELLADRLASRYAGLAGYDPRAMISFLKKLQEINRGKPLRPRSYFKTHPYVPDRIRVVKQELGEKIDFSDYINIEDKLR